MDSKKPKIGLALGAGGARGLAHIGVLKILRKEGIEPDMVAGVSMGSMVGALLALGISVEEMEAEVIDFNRTKAMMKLMDVGLPKRSILKGKKAYIYIEKLIKDKNFSDTKVPFRAVATDLGSGEEVILNSGDLAKAIQASISVPGIFPPVKIGSRYLIDGGVVNPTPIDVVRDMGADIIIGVDLVMRREIKLKDPTLIATLMQSYEIIRTQSVKHKIETGFKNAVIIKPKMRGTIDSFKFYDIGKFISSGEDAAREALPEIRKILKKFEK